MILGGGPWVGKTADLKSAYKQFCLHPSQFWAAVICAFDPVEQRTALMPQFTLPFGAAGAVLRFNRISRLLWHVGVGNVAGLD